jgi:hypothetical protein
MMVSGSPLWPYKKIIEMDATSVELNQMKDIQKFMKGSFNKDA